MASSWLSTQVQPIGFAADTTIVVSNGDDIQNEDYVFDDENGDWMPASQQAKRREASSSIEVRDAAGNVLADGDQVTLVEDLYVKGAGQTLKRATLIKAIRLPGDPQEIDCKFEGLKGLVLRTEFVRKRWHASLDLPAVQVLTP